MDMTETLVGQSSLPPVDEDNQVDSESFGFKDQTESADKIQNSALLVGISAVGTDVALPPGTIF
jgi:hypothetical protein